MPKFDLVLRGGRVVTPSEVTECDVGISDGTIAELGRGLGSGAREIDATDRLVLPGGIDSHCHIEQLSSAGVMNADDFYSGTVSAAFGGTTTIIPFAAQHRGMSVTATVEAYHERAGPKAVIDYAFHLIVSDPTPEVLNRELPALIGRGYTSLKVYMTYDLLRLDDYQLLEVMSVARRNGAMMMVHAENHDMIRWLSDRLLAGGHVAPAFHAVSHARLAEGEATHRAISLGELLDVPLLIVHVSSAEGLDEIRRARARGLKVYGETCPQYLFLTAEDLHRPGMEGAMFCCSPPPRDEAAQAAMWQGLRDGAFEVYSSDHAPYRFDESGKLIKGAEPTFREIPMGVPGLELRLPLLFSEGVRTGRLTLAQFVALSAGNAAHLYGLHPRKGTIAVGADADLALWDETRKITVTVANLHDKAGYTPYEGRTIIGWPVTVISRGRVVVDEGSLFAEPGSGRFLRREISGAARPAGNAVPEMDPARNFGAKI